jgi:hypothetical protein
MSRARRPGWRAGTQRVAKDECSFPLFFRRPQQQSGDAYTEKIPLLLAFRFLHLVNMLQLVAHEMPLFTLLIPQLPSVPRP